MSNAFVTVRVMEDDEAEASHAIRAKDIFEIEDRRAFRVIHRKYSNERLVVLDELDDLLNRVNKCRLMGMPFACGGDE